MLQTKLKLGFARASRVIDELERYGIVGPQDPRNPATPAPDLRPGQLAPVARRRRRRGRLTAIARPDPRRNPPMNERSCRPVDSGRGRGILAPEVARRRASGFGRRGQGSMTTRDDARRGAATTRPDGLRLGSGRGDADRDAAACLDRPEPPREALRRPRARRASTSTAPSATRRSGPATSPPSSGASTASSRATSTRRASCATTRSTSGSTRTRSSPSGGASAAARRSPKTVLSVPKPIAQPRPGLQFSPGVVVAALLTIRDRRDRRLARRPGHAVREAADARR